MLRKTALATTLAALVVAPACGSSSSVEPSGRVCGLRIWHRPAGPDARVEIVGDWNGWQRPGVVPEAKDDGWRVAAIDVAGGEHAYAIIEDGEWLTDRTQPLTAFHEGREVALAISADCAAPELRVDRVETARTGTTGSATVLATFLPAVTSDGTRIVPESITVSERNGGPIPVVSGDFATGAIRLHVEGLAPGKYTYTITARDEAGRQARDVRAIVWIDGRSGGPSFDPRDAVLYQVMLDRFRGDGEALAPPATPAARAGGNLAGVRRAIESGELEALGVNTVWLSPLYDNPVGDFAGMDGRAYTSYHGYWPIDSRRLDARFAEEAGLDAFVRLAHGRGLRVVFDVVPNHVHEQHPYAKTHPDWFAKGCFCGQGTCDWASNIKTCWFTPYLPDLDWTRTDVAQAATADVLWWFDRFDADGVRIDAVPMMPRAATRRIAMAVRRRYEHPGHDVYVLGENFTGPGDFASLRYELGPFGLDGAFHFPLMWTLRDAIALESAPLSAIDTTFRAGEEAWAGSGAIMGLMIGNHDVARFASVSAGNADGDTWDSPPQPVDPIVYAKQRLALGAVFALPGAPVVYYGDEVGLAGRSDPDCRRVMPAESALLDAQRVTRELSRAIGKARACSMALRRGTLETLLADDERVVFARRTAEGDVAIVALARRPNVAADLPLPEPYASAALVDAVTKEARAPGPTLRLDTSPFSVHAWVAPACVR